VCSSDLIAAENAICYNCPPQWADWASQLKAIKKNLGINVPHDNKNSGQTLSQLLAEKDNPVADVAYYGVSFGIQAKEKGVAAAYKPKHWDEIPAGLCAPIAPSVLPGAQRGAEHVRNDSGRGPQSLADELPELAPG